MKKTLLFFCAAILAANFAFAQRATNSKIKGFEKEQVVIMPYAGSSDTNQIIWRAVIKEGWVYALGPNQGLKNSRTLYPGDVIVLKNRQDSLVGVTKLKEGEGYWGQLNV